MADMHTLIDAEDADGLVALGTEYFRDGDDQKAFECYRAACKLGSIVAMGNLGYCYQSGHGVPVSYHLAAYCFERASEQDDAASTLKLGDFYYSGKPDITRDRQRAAQYYHKAFTLVSQQSDRDDMLYAEICFRMALCKKDGVGMDANFEDAYEFYQEAVENLEYRAASGDAHAEKLMAKAEQGMSECEAHF
jgi:TPR repeat protein